jgi:hypothetical protein
MTVLLLTHLAAVFIGAWFGFLIASVLLCAQIADLTRENMELRSQLNAWRNGGRS